MTSKIGHNGPPEDRRPSDVKLEMVRAITNSWSYTLHEAMILIGLIANSDDEHHASRITATEIARYCKTKRKQTIWPAIRALEADHGVIVREGPGRGAPSNYTILPQRVIDSIIDHLDDRQGRRVPEKVGAPSAPKLGTQSAPTSPRKGAQSAPTNPQVGTQSAPSTPSALSTPSAPTYPQVGAPSAPKLGTQSAPTHTEVGAPAAPTDPKKPNDPMCADARVGARPSSSSSLGGIKKEEEGPRVFARAEDLPEIDGLNGQTATYVSDLAHAENQFAPDYETAHKLIKGFVNVYGPDVTNVGFLQWQAALANKSSRAMKNPFRSLPTFIDNIYQNRQQAPAAKRGLKAKGLKSFSELLEEGGQ